jgi:RecJ-like exonuclease
MDKQNNNPPLFSIDIQLTNTDFATLTINENDDIEKKIKLFCEQHNLPSTAESLINEQVMNQLNNQILECKI